MPEPLIDLDNVERVAVSQTDTSDLDSRARYGRVTGHKRKAQALDEEMNALDNKIAEEKHLYQQFKKEINLQGRMFIRLTMLIPLAPIVIFFIPGHLGQPGGAGGFALSLGLSLFALLLMSTITLPFWFVHFRRLRFRREQRAKRLEAEKHLLQAASAQAIADAACSQQANGSACTDRDGLQSAYGPLLHR